MHAQHISSILYFCCQLADVSLCVSLHSTLSLLFKHSHHFFSSYLNQSLFLRLTRAHHPHCLKNEWVQLQKPHIHASSCLSGLVVQFRGLHGQKRQALEATQSFLVLSFEEKRKNLSRQRQWWQQQQSPPQRWEQRIKTKAKTKTDTKSSVS